MAVTIDGVGEINGVVLPTTSFGKVLQVVRATDTTSRSTNSTSLVDITGMSVTITPQRSTSAILLMLQVTAQMSWNGSFYRQDGTIRITDSANNFVGGGDVGTINMQAFSSGDARFVTDIATVIGYATPATTSPVTYKGRFSVFEAGGVVSLTIRNNVHTGQMYAIEVSA